MSVLTTNRHEGCSDALYVGNLLIRSVAKHRDQMIAKDTGAPSDDGMAVIRNPADVSVETMGPTA